MEFINSFFTQFLIFLYSITGSLGWTIIVFTLIMRLILLPLTLPSLKAQNKIKKIQPELKELKKKHGSNKQAYQQAQMDLYKKYNVNPLAGCLPQLLQLGVLILLYNALNSFIKNGQIDGVSIDPFFLWLNLSLPDPRYVIPILAAATQFVLSLMIAPGAEVKDEVPNQSQSKVVQKANEKEEDAAEMAATMQQQMLYIMPLFTGFLALSFPSGLGLYWVATTVFSVVQQYFISGPGGLATYWMRAQRWLSARNTTSSTTALAENTTVYPTPMVKKVTGKSKKTRKRTRRTK